jgi:hypothetical protein
VPWYRVTGFYEREGVAANYQAEAINAEFARSSAEARGVRVDRIVLLEEPPSRWRMIVAWCAAGVALLAMVMICSGIIRTAGSSVSNPQPARQRQAQVPRELTLAELLSRAMRHQPSDAKLVDLVETPVGAIRYLDPSQIPVNTGEVVIEGWELGERFDWRGDTFIVWRAMLRNDHPRSTFKVGLSPAYVGSDGVTVAGANFGSIVECPPGRHIYELWRALPPEDGKRVTGMQLAVWRP